MTRHPWLRFSLSTLALAVLAGSLTLAGCKKKEEAPAPEPEPAATAPAPAATDMPTTDVATPLPGSVSTGDADLQKKVKDTFTADARLAAATGIEIDAQNGTITLWGTTPNEDAKKVAEEVAKGIAGVTAVKNQIVVEAKK